MAEGVQLSIVIPTRDRADHLAETLAAVAEQFQAEAMEVIVIDDGSTDATPELLASERFAALDLRWRRQDPVGPAIARNLALPMIRGQRALLLGDDTRPAPGALRAHLEVSEPELAVQGRIDWDPRAPITPVMEFLAPEGPQFYFKGLTRGETIPYTAVLGSNLSAPTAWLREDSFDESFPNAALEDTELAYRWWRKGRRAIYDPEAICWHHHHYETLEPFLERQQRMGRAARLAVALHPEMVWPLVAKPLLMGGVILLRHGSRTLRGRRREQDSWDLRSRRAFLRGFLTGTAPQGNQLDASQ